MKRNGWQMLATLKEHGGLQGEISQDQQDQ